LLGLYLLAARTKTETESNLCECLDIRPECSISIHTLVVLRQTFRTLFSAEKNNRLIELSTVSRVCDITGTCTALRDYNDVFYCSVSSKNLLTWTNVSTICIVFTTLSTCIMWHMLSLTYRSICLSHSCIILRLLNQSSNGKLFFSC